MQPSSSSTIASSGSSTPASEAATTDASDDDEAMTTTSGEGSIDRVDTVDNHHTVDTIDNPNAVDTVDNPNTVETVDNHNTVDNVNVDDNASTENRAADSTDEHGGGSILTRRPRVPTIRGVQIIQATHVQTATAALIHTRPVQGESPRESTAH